MPSDPQRVQAIFIDAVQKSEPERAEFLERECAGDSELRGRVDALIAAHDQSGSFLDSPPKDLAGTNPTIAHSMPEQVGSLIGPFKLLQQIGEGGMGAVYMAEQIEPVERRVALKIIKPGMDTKAVIARFEAERQALAMMDHPNIAKVLDVATTNSGRPYFVMELIRGVPITQYCDEHQLTPRQRLELFLPVCQAVQHAHQKGIIHRDIKPSNVLVAEYDDRPVPKIIDFGLAKAMEKRLTAKTMFTEFGQVLGTPDYMSPEQAKLNQMDIDTRSDIYSLGVLLYELLSGNTPFDRQRLRSAAFDELLRIIREEEPPKPSQRLSTVDTLPSIAANRHITPAELTRQLSGELDWIVMKSIEKDRTRRYETANGLAADIRRFLDDEPVVACPPSTAYRFHKFARRNKATIVTVSLIGIALILGLAGTSWQAVRATRAKNEEAVQRMAAVTAEKVAKSEREAAVATRNEAESLRRNEVILRQKAEQASDVAESRRVEAEYERHRAEKNFSTARDAVDRLITRVAERLQGKPHMEQIRRDLLEDALEFYQGFLKQRSNNPDLKLETALAHRRAGEIQGLLGIWEKSLVNHQASAEILTELNRLSPVNIEHRAHLARSHYYLADASLRLAQFQDAEAYVDAGVSVWEELVEAQPKTPGHLEDFLRLVRKGQSIDSAQYKWTRELHARAKELLSRLQTDFPNYPVERGLLNVAVADGNRGLVKDIESLKTSERTIREQIKVLEEQVETHPDVPDHEAHLCVALANLGAVLLAMDRFEELEPLAVKMIAIRQKLAENHPGILEYQIGLGWTQFNHGLFLYYMGREAEATNHLRAAIEIASQVLETDPNTIRHYSHLVGMLVTCPATKLREPERAIQLATRQLQLGAKDWNGLAAAQVRAGRYEEALATCQKAKEEESGLYQSQLIDLYGAVAQWHVRDKEEARRAYKQATKAIDEDPGLNRIRHSLEYRLFRREVEEMMGIDPDTSHSTSQVVVDQTAARSYANQARIHRETGNMELAIAYFEASIRLGGKKPLYELLACYKEMGSLDQALERISIQVKDQPQSAGLRQLQGGILQELARYSEACESYSEALQIDSTLAWARLRLGHCYQLLGDREAALSHYLASLNLQAPDRVFIFQRGERFLELQENQHALNDFERGLEISPAGFTHMNKRAAFAHFRLGEYQQALEDLAVRVNTRPSDTSTIGWIPPAEVAQCLDEAFKSGMISLADRLVETSDQKGGALVARSQLLLALGNGERALQDLEQATEHFAQAAPSFDECYRRYSAALLCLKLGDNEKYRESVQALQQRFATTEDSNSQHFVAWTACLFPEAVEDYSTVLALAEKAVSADPANDQYQTTLAGLRFRAGEHQVARELLLKIAKRGENPNAKANSSPAYGWYFLAMTQQVLGNAKEAKTLLAKATVWMNNILSNEKDPPAWNRSLTLELLRDQAEQLLGLTASDRDQLIAEYYSDPPPADATVDYWKSRALWHGKQSDYEQVVADWTKIAEALERKLDHQPNGWLRSHSYAKALVASGQLTKYRKFCAELLEQHGQTEDPKIARKLTNLFLLGPDAVDDWSLPLRLSQLVLDSGDHRVTQHVSKLLCRAGEYERSLELRAEAIARAGREPHAWDCLWQAMAHQGLGNIEMAKEMALKARQLADTGGLGADNNDVFELMYRELADPVGEEVKK